MHEGEGFRLERFPLGTRVIYPPESLPGDPRRRRRDPPRAAEPARQEPLPELLRPGMRLTIVFDDLSLPLPPMRRPDIRQRMIEQVLEMAAAKGVDDVELIAGNALHRRMTPAGAEAHRRRAGVPLVLPATTCATTTPRTADNLLELGTTGTARTWRSTAGRPRAT